MDKKIELINLLKSLKYKEFKENIKFKNINTNKELISKGILFDNENTCYHDYENIEDVMIGLMVSADNYGIYYKDKYIGIISVFYQYYKDLSKLEISINIDSNYRNIGIGSYCYDYIIDKYFERDDIKSFHLAIREDNLASRKLAEKFNFKIYEGYKRDKYFYDINGNCHNQVQYLLKKKDYKKVK